MLLLILLGLVLDVDINIYLIVFFIRLNLFTIIYIHSQVKWLILYLFSFDLSLSRLHLHLGWACLWRWLHTLVRYLLVRDVFFLLFFRVKIVAYVQSFASLLCETIFITVGHLVIDSNFKLLSGIVAVKCRFPKQLMSY